MLPKLNFYVGGGCIGQKTTFDSAEKVQRLLDVFKANGKQCMHIDTAARYPALAPGTSEELMGQIKATGMQGFILDTKILAGGPGCLSRDAINRSFSGSLERLQLTKVRTLYCHTPDYETPLEEQARAFDDLYHEGKFERLGVSNFSASMLKDLLSICENKGYVKPTVYQGLYNPLARHLETELAPLLRKHSIELVAFSPLGGGVFTGNIFKGDEATEGTRYEKGNPVGDYFRGQYTKPAMVASFQNLAATIEPLGITGPEAALRWICYHSVLSDGDGLILGASKVEHVERNFEDIKKGPLPEEVLNSFESMWEAVAEGAPSYYI